MYSVIIKNVIINNDENTILLLIYKIIFPKW